MDIFVKGLEQAQVMLMPHYKKVYKLLIINQGMSLPTFSTYRNRWETSSTPQYQILYLIPNNLSI